MFFMAALAALPVFCVRYAVAQSFAAKLPYENKQSFVVTQGYDSPPTHIHKDAYAADFTQDGCNTYGKNILAAAPGKAWIVEEAGYNGGYGTEILVAGDGNIVSRYAHLIQGSIAVNDGDAVKTGAVLGKLGDTGLVMGTACAEHPGAHLHFAMYDKNADGSFSAHNFEPISGYTGIKEEARYVSDNGAPDTGLLGDIGAIMAQAAGNLFGAAGGVGSDSNRAADNGLISGATSSYESIGASSISGTSSAPAPSSRDFSGENSKGQSQIITKNSSLFSFSTGRSSDGNNIFDATTESSSAESLNNGAGLSSAPSGIDSAFTPANSPAANSSVLSLDPDSAASNGLSSQNYSSDIVSSTTQDISDSSGGGNGSTSLATSGQTVPTGGVSATITSAPPSFSAASPEDSSALASAAPSGTIGQAEDASSSAGTDTVSDYSATSTSAASTDNTSSTIIIADIGVATTTAVSSVASSTTLVITTSTASSTLVDGFSSITDAISTSSPSTASASTSTATSSIDSVVSSSASPTQLSDATSSAVPPTPVFVFAPPSHVAGMDAIAVFNSSTLAIDFIWAAPQDASGSSDGIVYSVFDLDAASTSSPQTASGTITDVIASGTPPLWTGTSTSFSYPVSADGHDYYFGIRAVDVAGDISFATATVAIPDWSTTVQAVDGSDSHGSHYDDNWYDLGTGFYGTIRSLTFEGYIDDPFFFESSLWIGEFLDPGYTKLNRQFTISDNAPFIHANTKVTVGGLNIALQPNKYYRLYTYQGCQNRSVILKGTMATGTAMWNAFVYGSGKVPYTYSFYPYLSWVFIPNFPPHMPPSPPTDIVTSVDPATGQLDLSWSASTDPDTASSSLAYEINCGTSPTLDALHWQSVGSIRLGFCAIDPANTYYIGVRAVDYFGNVSAPTMSTWALPDAASSTTAAASQ